MCAIVDADVSNEVFGSNPHPAGERFFDWINSGRGRLVAGGKLLRELEASSEGFREWAAVARSAGKMRIVGESEVDTRAKRLLSEGTCKSNDHHVIALAQVSGARLLFSNDGDLQQDFRDKNLVDRPRGQVYSTRRREDLTRGQRRLMARRDLCARETVVGSE